MVVKVGTSSLLRADGTAMALSCLATLVETVVDLRHQGRQVVLVVSGAVGMGCLRLGLRKPPTDLGKKQALAAQLWLPRRTQI